jgi:hypothetical protein
LRPGGRLLIRSMFSGRLPDLPWHRYFPRARALEALIFPTLAEVKDTSSAAGLRFVALDRVRQQVAPSLAAYAERLRLRALSTFSSPRAGTGMLDAVRRAMVTVTALAAGVWVAAAVPPGQTLELPPDGERPSFKIDILPPQPKGLVLP